MVNQAATEKKTMPPTRTKSRSLSSREDMSLSNSNEGTNLSNTTKSPGLQEMHYATSAFQPSLHK